MTIAVAPSTPGKIITWRQSTPFADILAQIEPGWATRVMLVDDGSDNVFSFNAAAGDLSAVIFDGGNVAQEQIFVDTGWSFTGGYLTFVNCQVIGRTAPLVPSGSDALVQVQGTDSTFTALGSPLFYTDAAGTYELAMVGLFSGLGGGTGPVIVLGDGSTLDMVCMGQLATNDDLTASIVLAAGASAATVVVEMPDAAEVQAGVFGTGVAAAGPHGESGAHAFAASDAPTIAVTFRMPFLDVSEWQPDGLAVTMTNDTDVAPSVWISSPTATGFLLHVGSTTAACNVSWSTKTTL